MQEKSNKNFTAKERVLQYLENKHVTQYDFSKRTGLSNGFLKSGSSISSDNLQLLSNIYPDLDIMWVITGQGPMLRESKSTEIHQAGVLSTCNNSESQPKDSDNNTITQKNNVPDSQRDAEMDRLIAMNESLMRQNETLSRQIDKMLELLKKSWSVQEDSMAAAVD